MRISDWSSDVCSSDLGFRLLPSFVDQFNADDQGNKASWATGDDGVFKSVFFMPAGAVSVLRSCRHMLALDACHLRGYWGHGRLLFAVGMDAQDQIGRASCRERGCQYV